MHYGIQFQLHGYIRNNDTTIMDVGHHIILYDRRQTDGTRDVPFRP